MKRPLFTRSLSRVKDSSSYLFLIIGMFVFPGLGEMYAQPILLDARTNLSIASSECNCLDNASTPLNGPSNGQYSEQIIISTSPAPGMDWIIVSTSGYYSPSSPPPPGIPVSYIVGTIIPETVPGSGIYVLDGIRVSGQSWNVVFTNGTNHYTISSINSCSYPSLAEVGINGPRSVCTDSDAAYDIAATLANASFINWTVMGGTLINGQGTPAISVDWGAIPVGGSVNVTGFLSSYPGQSDPCAFSHTIQVSVVSEVAEVMACNNLVNISMNPSCEMFITAEMILQDMQYNNDAYNIILTDLSNGQNIPLGTLGYSFINKIIKVEVFNACSGNSCWGYARIEDKSIPELICPDTMTVNCDDDLSPLSLGFPFGPMFNPANIFDLGGGRYRVINFDPCSDITVQYVDAVVFNSCLDSFSSVITRTWIATDNTGNTSSCEQIINVLRADLADVTFPPNYDDVLGDSLSIEACSGYPTFPVGHPYFGHPHPDFTGWPQGTVCLSGLPTFTDTKLAKCGDKSFKILRRWVIFDHCTLTQRNHTQTITVMDRMPPAIVAPDEFTVGTSLFVCGGTIDVPPPILVSPECSAWDYTVAYKPADPAGNPFEFATTAGVIRLPNGNYRINNVITDFPRVWIIYTATDACGNQTVVFTEVDIIDTERPVPVCDKTSIISVSEDGMAFAGVLTFDDGSWDNCGIYKMEVARMDPSNCTDTQFRDEVKFCCSDIGTKVRVILRVWDLSNNFNECMVEAEVQDNIPPMWTFFPPDVTVDCVAVLGDFTQFGTATAKDNCDVDVDFEIQDYRNECGIGEIWRVWTAVDEFGNEITRIQRIFVVDLTPFGRPNITFPTGPVNITGCTSRDVLPEDLPPGRQRPTFNNTECALVSPEYEDIIFQYTTEACVKILRKWTVIDWCQRDPLNPLLPRSWSEFQVIMVNNNIGPNILSGHRPEDLIITPVGICSANVRVTATATDDCTESEDIIWTFAIDFGNNNSNDITGNGNTINQLFEYGTHKITWTAKDECGNVTTRTNIFTLVDTKKPTPYCISEIVTVIMPTSQNVTIWASDFDLGSLDNCTSVTASFSPTNRMLISRTITCADMVAKTTPINIKIYFIDQQGNFDFCDVILHVQDNNNSCGFGLDGNGSSGRISISGNLYQSNMLPMESIDIQLNADLPEFPIIKRTNIEGQFLFNNLEKNNEYVVNPILNKDHSNGVSTLDLVLIQRHILDIEKFNSPYKIIASDVNNDMKINAIDLVELRKVILGIHEEFANNKSWRFVETSQNMNPDYPFPFIEKVKMTNLDYSIGGIDFVGVKVGDVNQSAQMNANSNRIETRASTHLVQNRVQGKAGEIVEVQISGENQSKVVGLQMSMYLPSEIGNIIDVQSQTLDIQNEHIAWNQSNDGIVNVSWNSIHEWELGQQAITVKIKLNKDVANTELLSLLDGGLTPEIYTVAGSTVKADVFRFKGEINGQESFELFQNVPNPFSGKTTIGFQLPAESDVKVSIFDVTGKVLHTQSAHFSKGRHNIDINMDQMDINGLLYYRIDTQTDSAVKRMIAIK